MLLPKRDSISWDEQLVHRERGCMRQVEGMEDGRSEGNGEGETERRDME